MFGLIRENVMKLHDTDNGNYEGYPDFFILYGGWGVALFALVMGILLTLPKWKQNTLIQSDYDEE